MDSKPLRGTTRLPLVQIEQNVQPEKKSTFFKSTQRPLSAPNLKSLFNGNTKSTNNQNRDVGKEVPSEFVSTAYVPPSRKGLVKRNTTIFRDPILKTVEEVDDGTVAPSAASAPKIAVSGVATEPNCAVAGAAIAPQPDSFHNLPAQRKSTIESRKAITFAHPDAKKDIVTVTASEPQTTNKRIITSIYTDPPALLHVSEPEVQEILEAANAAKQYPNPPALPNSTEPSVQDTKIIQDGLSTKLNPLAQSATSEPVVQDAQVIGFNARVNLPALSNSSEPDVQDTQITQDALDTKLNPPALSATSELVVQDAQTVKNTKNTNVNPPALSSSSEPVIHKVSSSPNLKESLIVQKVRGPAQPQSNPAFTANVDTIQVNAFYHGAPQQSGTRNVPQPGMPMVSEDRIVSAFLRNVPQSSITVGEAAIADSVYDTRQEDENEQAILGSTIPMTFKGRKVSALWTNEQAPAPATFKEPEDAQTLQAAMKKATSGNIRKSSLENGPPLPDPNAPKGLRAAVAKSIKANALKSNGPIAKPKEELTLSVKKRRDATLRAADYPQPLPWAPVMQPPGTYQYVDNSAAVDMLGPKAVPSRYVTPHYTLPPELHGVDPSRDEDAYDSYDEEDDYVTARSYRSNGETTNDGVTTDLFPRYNSKARREIAEATLFVESTRTQEDVDDEAMDPTMVAEYADEIFAHLRHLEIKMLPNPFYMEEQNELQWSMRSVLMDWLVQVHSRCNLLPETLFITANFVDRFLSGKIVSLGKLQLVGATSLFLAAKKEEINCPTLSEIVYMVDNTYNADELIKAERFMLNILKWELEFPGPMSFLRRISKADDYDLETRTLAKYFLEVALMEERFIGTPCSCCAAASHCMARLMLQKGLWTPFHVYYSNYTYSQLHPLLRMLLICVENPMRHHAAVFEKYADKRFKRASTYVEVQMQRGFSLPNPPTSSNRKIVDDVVPTHTTATYSNPFNFHAAAAPSSGRIFSV